MVDVLKTLIYIVIFLFPLGELARFSFGNSIAIRIQDFFIGVIACFSLISLQKNRKDNLFKPIILFFLFGLLSLILASNHLTQNQLFASFSYAIRWISYALIYFVIFRFNKQTKISIYNSLLIIGVIVDIVGLIQYFMYQNLRNLFYLGWDDHLYRLFSSFLDPNFSGSFYVLFFLLLLGVVYKQIRLKKFSRKTIFLSGLLFLTLCTIFLTYSRSAMLMFLTGTTSFFILVGKKKLIAFPFAVLFLFLIIVSPFFYIENINIFRTASSQARLDSTRNAGIIIKDNPIFGIGFNAYRYAQIQYGFRKGQGAIVSHSDAGTDNSFLFVLATTGIAGFISYLFLWYRIFQKLWISSGDKILPVVVIASSIALFVDSLFVNSLFFPPLMFWMWVLIGIMDCR